MSCELHQTLMLELAYGLLDAADADALRQHAATCNACTQALNDSKKHQALLSRAAKFQFDNVTFETPRTEVLQPVGPSKATWMPWMIAAGVMLLIGTPLASIYLSKPDVPETAAIDQGVTPKPPVASAPVEVPGRTIRESEPKEWSAATKNDATAKYKLLLIGPSKAMPNADNLYSVTAADAKGAPLKVRVTVLVRDAKGNVHFKESFETGKQFKLAAAEWSKFPAEGVSLVAMATHPATQDRVEVIVPLR